MKEKLQYKLLLYKTHSRLLINQYQCRVTNTVMCKWLLLWSSRKDPPTHTHARARTHARAHTHTRARAHTHTHTHTQSTY